MILTPLELHQLLDIINTNQATMIGREFGIDFLSDQDIQQGLNYIQSLK